MREYCERNKTNRYLRMEGTVKEEIDMEEDLRKPQQAGVPNLLTWSKVAEEVKASVYDITKQFLDAALDGSRSPTTISTPIYLEGYYDSVYNARWSHVVELPGGERTVMEVRDGETPQSWTYKAVVKPSKRMTVCSNPVQHFSGC
ncbi:retrotransposon hot spot (RHS) protein [Trypanosoma cruzi]|nr:retrotransposon hot spot (RHS) protein [Trypanosoma cruzi]